MSRTSKWMLAVSLVSATAVIAVSATAATASTVTLYDGKDRNGSSITMSGQPGTLELVPSSFDNRASSYRVSSGEVVLHTSRNGPFCAPINGCFNYRATGSGNLPSHMNNAVSAVSYR
jgi:hypothetical protein